MAAEQQSSAEAKGQQVLRGRWQTGMRPGIELTPAFPFLKRFSVA